MIKVLFSSFLWDYSLSWCTDEVEECLTPKKKGATEGYEKIFSVMSANFVCKNLKDSKQQLNALRASVAGYLRGLGFFFTEWKKPCYLFF